MKTKKISASASNSRRKVSQTSNVASSLPYEAAKPAFARLNASSASGQMPALLSLANWRKYPGRSGLFGVMHCSPNVVLASIKPGSVFRCVAIGVWITMTSLMGTASPGKARIWSTILQALARAARCAQAIVGTRGRPTFRTSWALTTRGRCWIIQAMHFEFNHSRRHFSVRRQSGMACRARGSCIQQGQS